MAHAEATPAELKALECSCCGARSQASPWDDALCGNCAIDAHTCCVCGEADHLTPDCPEG